MEKKRNLVRRAPTEEEINALTFPKEKFDLVSVDYVDEWDLPKSSKPLGVDDTKYINKRRAVHITVRCKKCGTVHKEATDRPNMRCQVGPCHNMWMDLTGRRFGKLLVEKCELGKTTALQKKNKWVWKCKCDCGRYTYKTQHALVTMGYQQCNVCGRKEAIAKTTLPNGLSKWHRMIRYYKKNAASFNRPFELTEQQFMEVASSNCMYCGAPPKHGAYNVVCNGIDRIDNDKGYIPGNVGACCTWCNYMKGKHTKEEFLNHVKTIYDNCNLKLNDHPEREYASSEAEMGASHENG